MTFKEYKEEIKYWGKPYPPITKLTTDSSVVLDLVIGRFYSAIGRLGANKNKAVIGKLGWCDVFKTFHLTNNGNEHSITPIDIRTLNAL